MKVKITFPIPEKSLQAGLIYDLPEKEAREIVENDWGFAVDEPKPRKPKKDSES
jgi:hypothetical protein